VARRCALRPGKLYQTQLALEYVYRSNSEDRIVWWIDGSKDDGAIDVRFEKPHAQRLSIRRTGEMVPLFNPRSDHWNEHFRRENVRLIRHYGDRACDN
jgi:hypothetical protein